MSLLQAGFGSSGDDYEITDSLRLRSSASAYLARTPLSAGNRRTWTLSWWAKRGALGSTGFTVFSAGTSASDTGELVIKYDNNYPDSLAIQTGSTNIRFTNALYRDPSAWHHVVVAFDTTQATAANRHKVYVNGAQITSFNLSNDLAQNTDTAVNNNVTQEIGVFARINSQYLDGYLTEVHMIDGQQLDADDFGEYDANGTWKPLEYKGTYGTNGFYLPMKPTTQAEGFNTVLYDGNTQAMNVAGVGFSPDFVWIKNRIAGNPHYLYDSVRGVHNSLRSDATTAEDGYPYQLTSFDVDGFSLPTDTAGYNNYAGREYVAWCWDAGSGSAGSNTDGSVTTTVKASDEYGFGIISVPGQNNTSTLTVGHGLSTAPDMVIGKSRNGVGSWAVWHKDLSSASHTLFLNTTAAEAVDGGSPAAAFPAVSSSTITIQNYNRMFGSGVNGIVYAFAEVAGYSKIDKYTGNASTNGPVVTTGFRPAWIMTKASTGSSGWHITDTRRYPQNDTSTSMGWLDADSAAAEGDFRTYKVTDTGFQVLDNGSAVNGSGVTYIYMAIADTADAQFNFDASGNHNNFEPFNINSNGESATTYDLMKDTPSLVDENAGNFATLNPLDTTNSATAPTNGNLTAPTNTGAYRRIGSTIQLPRSGKWYFETHCDSFTSFPTFAVGLAQKSFDTAGGNSVGTLSTEWGYNGQSGTLVNNNTAISSGVNTVTTNDIMQIAYDGSTGKVWFGKNNTWQGAGSPNPATDTAPNYTGVYDVFPVVVQNWAAMSINFGQRPFEYTPPTGFLKINTFNLPDSTIKKGSDHMTPLLYSGNSSTQSITGADFQPDLTITKDRNHVTHVTAVDAVRGAPLDLFLSSTNGDSNDHNGLTAFTSGGFNLGSSTNHNVTGHSYVSFNWKANGSGSSNTAGSINSTASVNTTAGFSIVKYTGNGTNGATVGHGLGAVPDAMIIKNRDRNGAWAVYHSSLGATKYMQLDTNQAFTDATSWNNTAPTSTVFSLGTASSVNQSGEDLIAYCWTSIEGYSAFGSYTGTGSTDGPFVYTGFRPAWVLVKVAASQTNTTNWNVFDTTRSPRNVIPTYLFLDSAGVESDSASTYFNTDILSNGFKLRAANTYGINQSGATYIYMAFAENPFKNANAR